MPAAPPRVRYTVSIGGAQATEEAQGPLLLRRFCVTRGADGEGGHATVSLSPLSGEVPALGDPVTIAIGLDESQTIFTGLVRAISARVDQWTVEAWDGLAATAGCRAEGVFESSSLGDVVSALLQEAEATPGTVSPGPQLPRYTVHHGVVRLHLQRLARLGGFSLWSDAAGKVSCAPLTGGPLPLVFGADLLDAHVFSALPDADAVEAWGEGSSASQGAAKAHWPAKDLSSLKGSGGDGTRTLRRVDGALRAADQAQSYAEAEATRRQGRSLRATLTLLGKAEVELGQSPTVRGLPNGLPLAALLQQGEPRVQRLRHRLDPAAGFVTELEL
jgi:hypothetical protein